MAGNPAGEPRDWAEASILPFSVAQPEAVLTEVVDRLIHERLIDRIGFWHYFWEYDPIEMCLRLRVLDAEERLAEAREFHPQRRAHLNSTPLSLSLFDKGSPRLAIGYLAKADPGATPDGASVLWTLSQSTTRSQRPLPRSR